MENQSTRRLSRLFPSLFGSCRFRNLSDAVHNSIVFTAANSDCSSFRTSSSLSKPRKSSVPVPPQNHDVQKPKSLKSFTDSELKNRSFYRETSKQSVFVKNSSSSNGGWFSSDGEEEEEEVRDGTESFFSLSSVSSGSPRRRRTKAPVSQLGLRRLPDPVTENSIDRSGSRRQKTPKSHRRSSNAAVAELGCRLFSNHALENSKPSSSFRSETGEKHRRQRRKTPKSRRRSRTSCFPENPADIFYSSPRNRRPNQRSDVRRCSVVVGDRVEESFAVMKASSDPYGDFRESMVDMIVEKEIYGIEDLQKLLERFLSLNSSHHHGIILDVFSEICQALIAD